MNKDVNNIPVAESNRNGRANKKKSRSRRWSAADTVVVILAVLALAGIVARLIVFSGKDLADYRGDGVTYAIEYTVDEIYEDAVDSIKALDTVTLLETGDTIGYIAPYDDYAPVINKMYIDGGENVKDSEFLKVSIKGTVFCNNATMKDGCLLVADGGKYIAPGSQVKLATPTAILDVKIVKISTAE